MRESQQDWLGRLHLTPGGTAALVELRRELVAGLDAHPEWADVEADLAHLFRVWFDPAGLELRRITERTSPVILESLIRYEAVHKIHSWRELMRRLKNDRRCYGFFHPALPHEPVIFIELAFTKGISAKVQPLLDPDSPVVDPAACDSAMFYSISSCHEGLRGVAFGNALIRRVVEALGREFSGLKTFATVSPVPGFRAWLTRTSDRAEIVARVNEHSWMSDEAKSAALEKELVPLCAAYLLHAKRGSEPADPVARFHLGNGARLERLNWMGDISDAGLARSAGLTANYLYSLDEVDTNFERYRVEHTIIASNSVSHLAGF